MSSNMSFRIRSLVLHSLVTKWSLIAATVSGEHFAGTEFCQWATFASVDVHFCAEKFACESVFSSVDHLPPSQKSYFTLSSQSDAMYVVLWVYHTQSRWCQRLVESRKPKSYRTRRRRHANGFIFKATPSATADCSRAWDDLLGTSYYGAASCQPSNDLATLTVVQQTAHRARMRISPWNSATADSTFPGL